ncbi:hypothetical protein NDU88_005733 [Pleurodeles waltl]|uniref:Uncharacterized protein n=1 Tax=Pleurodeles waltl TaxID=8319 RepID=A0AAV7WW33_PLEWA|nr:hypothetical protein NDU88_005733 [Pleurodeles waltl]
MKKEERRLCDITCHTATKKGDCVTSPVTLQHLTTTEEQERKINRTPEDEAQAAVIKESNTEEEDTVGMSSITPVSDAGEDVVGQSSAIPEGNTGKYAVGQSKVREERSAAGNMDLKLEKEVKGSSKQLEKETSAACHVPEGMWGGMKVIGTHRAQLGGPHYNEAGRKHDAKRPLPQLECQA